jgi:uncharacterized phiE125 gp8 family phage protein
MIIFPAKAPAEVERFAFEWADVLGGGTITGSPDLDPTGVTIDSQALSGTQVQLQLSGGTAGTVATVVCTIATSLGETLSELAVIPIGGEVISLATAKLAQKIDSSEEDVLLGSFLRAAIGHVERATAKNLTEKVEHQVASGFPRGDRALRLWKGPASSILEVKYDDAEGVEQTLSSFRLVEGAHAKLLPAFGSTWPVTACGEGTVRISYIAGYAPEDLPPELPQAAILLFGHFNANREAVNIGGAVTELPLGVEAMIAPYRVPGIAQASARPTTGPTRWRSTRPSLSGSPTAPAPTRRVCSRSTSAPSRSAPMTTSTLPASSPTTSAAR